MENKEKPKEETVMKPTAKMAAKKEKPTKDEKPNKSSKDNDDGWENHSGDIVMF